MIFDLDAIMRFLSGVMTLEPGDVIATGTPPGVGSLQVGDTVEVVIEGIGRLRNSIVAESGA
jgi:2-keto-4-pentenoate hydratase/2-oxohepta-3-ene-1,7-dioic acid hydratase in catechol pathway